MSQEKKDFVEEVREIRYTDAPPPYELKDALGNTVIIVEDAPADVAIIDPDLTSTIKSADPVNVVCPYCNKQVQTKISYDYGVLTWLLVGGLCLIGCWGGCCLVPLCVKDAKDVIHSCPECERVVARYRRVEL